jgi:hypothetical protein
MSGVGADAWGAQADKRRAHRIRNRKLALSEHEVKRRMFGIEVCKINFILSKEKQPEGCYPILEILYNKPSGR